MVKNEYIVVVIGDKEFLLDSGISNNDFFFLYRYIYSSCFVVTLKEKRYLFKGKIRTL